MTRDGELATRDYLSLVLSGIGKESDIGVVQSLHRQVKLAIDLYADAGRGARPVLTRWTDATLAHLRAAEPGSDHQLAWARAFAATARTPEQLDLLAGAAGRHARRSRAWPSTPSCAGRSCSGSRRSGRFDEAEIAGEYERDKTAAGERHAATARAARPTEEAKAEAWASVVESDKLPNAVQEAVIGGFVQTDQRELLAPYTDEVLRGGQGRLGLPSATRSPSRSRSASTRRSRSPQETLDATDAWLASAEPNAALRRLVSESRAGVERALKAQAADAAAAG